MSKHDLKARQLQVEEIISPSDQPINVGDLLRYEQAQDYSSARDIPDIEKVQSLIGESTGDSNYVDDNVSAADYVPSTNTGTDDSAALNTLIASAPEGAVIRFKRNRIYRLMTPLTTVGKKLSYYLNGSTLYAGAEEPIFRDSAVYDFKDVTATIERVSVINPLNDSSSLTKCLKITPGASVNLKEGDVIKLTSVDQIPGSNTGATGGIPRMGQFLIVMQVLEGYFYTTCEPEEVENYITGVKIHKPKDTQIQIYGGNISGVEAPFLTLTDANPLIEFLGSKKPKVYDVVSLRSAGSVIELRGTYAHEIDVILQNAESYESVQKYGYGVREISAQFGRVQLRATNCRHGYTTNSLPFTDLSTTQSYGRTMFSLIKDSMAYGCSNAGFDTHDGAWEITFDNCHTVGSYAGVSSNGSGFSVRGHNIHYRNCSSRAVRYGVYMAEQYPGGSNAFTFDSCDFYGYERAINTTTSNGGILLEDVKMNNCILRSGGKYVIAHNKTQLHLNNCELHAYGDTVGDEVDFINAGTDGKIEGFNTRFYRYGTTVTNFVTLQDSGCIINLRGSRYNSDTVNIGRLVKGNGYTATVNIFGLETNRSINTLLSSGDNVKFSYGVRYLTDTRNDLEGYTALTLTVDNQPVPIDYLNCQEINVAISVSNTVTADNILLGAIPKGYARGQILIIRNGSSTTRVTLADTTNLILTTNGVIDFRRTFYGRFNGTAWEEMDGSNVRLSGNQSNIQGRKIFNEMIGLGSSAAGTGSSILNSALSLDIANGGGCAFLGGADNGARTRTDSKDKFLRVASAPYKITGRPVTTYVTQNTATQNILNIGGGTDVLDALTLIRLFLSPTLETVQGVNTIEIDSTGIKYVNDLRPGFGNRHLVTKDYVDGKGPQKYTGSGNGTTTITIPHGLTGITSSRAVLVTANNTNAANFSYVTLDATNINIFYTVAPPVGTNNLTYSVTIN